VTPSLAAKKTDGQTNRQADKQTDRHLRCVKLPCHRGLTL